jgi:glycosyltransferase involved in cell wall biosynthesis
MKSFLFLLLACSLHAKTICLNMIVKDEAPVIERCLASVKDQIDYWVIVDTGSTDGTQDIIRKFMADIPGELHERPWVNFGHNREEALRLADGKADYALFIDADEVMESGFNKDNLDGDAFLSPVRTCKDPYMTFLRALMVSADGNWYWGNIVHEKLTFIPGDARFVILPDVILAADTRDGHRSQDPDKYLKDAQKLIEALKTDPENADYVYYTAQSLHNAQHFEEALQYYAQRATMTHGWDQHTFWSQYEVGQLSEQLKKSPEEIIDAYSKAYRMRPTRLEPLFRLAQYFYSQKNPLLGYLVASYGRNIPFPATDIVYIEHWIYHWGHTAVLANCAMELGRYEEASELYAKLSTSPDTPANVITQAKSSRRWTQSKIIEQQMRR